MVFLPKEALLLLFLSISGGSRTLLHEIGHGAFDLGHTHDIKNAVDNKNLMSYPPGPELRAYQWQLIQQKVQTIGRF